MGNDSLEEVHRKIGLGCTGPTPFDSPSARPFRGGAVEQPYLFEVSRGRGTTKTHSSEQAL